MDLFRHLNETFNTTIIMVTHDKEVADFAMRTVYIRDGKLYQDQQSVVDK